MTGRKAKVSGGERELLLPSCLSEVRLLMLTATPISCFIPGPLAWLDPEFVESASLTDLFGEREDGRCETMCVTGEQILDVRLANHSMSCKYCRIYTRGF